MSLPTQRVLIAEVDAEMRGRLFKALLDLEVFSDVSSDSESAVRRLAGTRYVIVLLDVSDPLIDPARVLEAIAALPREDQPIVVAIGSGEAARTLESDLIHIVVRKPVSVSQIAELVQACVREIAAREPDQPSKGDGIEFRR